MGIDLAAAFVFEVERVPSNTRREPVLDYRMSIATYECYRDLLLGEQLTDEKICNLLSPAGFTDWQAANRCLQRLIHDPQTSRTLSDLLPQLLSTLAGAASPDRVLVNFERFAMAAPDRLALFGYLGGNPRAVEILVTLFAGSQFLTEILLRNPEYFERLTEHKRLAQLKSVDQFFQAARAFTESGASDADQLDALRRFQRWELLRIGTCDLLDLFDLPTVTAQLSNLADSLVGASLAMAAAKTNKAPDGFVVIGLGKLGGQELNYSSDIDLLFLAGSDATLYKRLGEQLIEALASTTAEGFLYRVDMRLRPWGRVGALVTSLDGYTTYLRRHARFWEKQALLKARVIAGDEMVGKEFLRRTESLLFGHNHLDVRAEVHKMKQRTEAHLRRHRRGWGEVKLGAGSIRDVEFVTQYLQLVHGGEHPEVRSYTTLEALGRLSTCGFLPVDDYRVLTDGYILLRTIEHYMQMMHYRQAHTLPDDREAIAHLAQRLGFQGKRAGDHFLARYQQHCAAIRSVYLRYLEGDKMKMPGNPQSSHSSPNVRRHMARMDPSYADVFSDEDIKQHTLLADRLDEENLVEVDAASLDDGSWRVTIVGYDYPGELSLICGLLFVYGFTICDGYVFTYEPLASRPPSSDGRQGLAQRRRTSPQAPGQDDRRKIVDAFTVKSVQEQVSADVWRHYRDDLQSLLRLMHVGKRREARGELAKRVAVVLRETVGDTRVLYPVDIEIDNDSSRRYTVLHIQAPDTIGFLYEFTNALAFNQVYIVRVTVDSVGNRVHDTLYVTDADDKKITAPNKLRELRAATVLIKHFTHLLPHSPNPESALLQFREFLGQLFTQPDWPDELASLERPEVLNALARLLGVSEFLWDDFLRMQHANLFPVVRDVDALTTMKSKEQLQAELEAELHVVHDGPQMPSEDAPWRVMLNAFKDREMFRVDMRHILGHTEEFWEFSQELTDLAEVVANAAYHLCHEDLRTQFGTPYLEDGHISNMCVFALGKFGGRELGFASDIELMFIYAGNGHTKGPSVITTTEFYEKLVQMFVGTIKAKREGIFEIDLQLRPYGKSSSLAVSLDAFRRYFALEGPAWAYERQALVKLRPVAGDLDLGQKIEMLRDEFIYSGEPFDTTAMRAMRERQIRHLVVGGTFNAKYSPGGLVDIEYLIQGLQITHGNHDLSLRLTNTREAMAALAAAGILSSDDYTRLRKAHTFLSWLMDALRVVRGNAKDLTVPPAGSEEFAFLARRLRYGSDLAQLSDDLARYTSCVQELSTQLLG